MPRNRAASKCPTGFGRFVAVAIGPVRHGDVSTGRDLEAALDWAQPDVDRPFSVYSVCANTSADARFEVMNGKGQLRAMGHIRPNGQLALTRVKRRRR